MRVRNYKKKTEESERKKLAPNNIVNGNETSGSLKYKTQEYDNKYSPVASSWFDHCHR